MEVNLHTVHEENLGAADGEMIFLKWKRYIKMCARCSAFEQLHTLALFLSAVKLYMEFEPVQR